ncbi:MAG: hypothetical protein AVO33_07750 [delta proteobacterium ML8_F1]|nr:MAG: hypothetical protein AVO33_07750 [delta proteobacterium ML8_F1]
MDVRRILFPKTRCALCGGEIFEDRDLCPDCLKKMDRLKRPREILGEIVKGHAVFRYRGEVKTLVLDFKYRDKRFLKDYFVQEMVPFLEGFGMDFDVIVPVPDSRQRRWTRGFNPSLSLSRGISKASGIPLSKGLLRRKRETRPLKEIPLNQRQAHLEGAFEAQNPLGFKRGLIVDDIYTTGATVTACGEALYAVGFDEIVFLAVASNY